MKPTSSILVRAAELHAQIIGFQSQLQEEIKQGIVPPTIDPTRVNIVGHSMGGLDARYMIAKLGGEKIVVRIRTAPSRRHAEIPRCLIPLLLVAGLKPLGVSHHPRYTTPRLAV